jgi:Phage terminase-like protein, large subunit
LGEGAGREVTETLPAPRERTDTLPLQLPERTLGYHAAAWMVDNLVQPNGPRAGQPFIPTDRQIEFLAHFYALNHKGSFVYRQGIRRLSKGSGKAECLTNAILTTAGWRRIGDLAVGDYVFHPSGKPTMVTQLHPVGQWDTWEVEVSDGTVLTVSGEHLFTVDEFVGSSKRKRRTLDVRAMAREGLVFDRPLTKGSTKATKGGVGKFALPETEPLEFPERDLPVDPWVLGYWLGDGTSSSGEATADVDDVPHVRERCWAAGYELSDLRQKKEGGRARKFTILGLSRDLREAGVLNDKHIPEEYLYASVEQRRALIQGLMDSDGYIDKKGSAEYCQVRKQIADGMAFLLRSMGVKVNVRESEAKLYGRVTGPRYRLTFKPYKHQNLVTLPRRAERVQEQRRKPIPRVIKDVRRVAPVDARCITVEAEDGLYVTGETMVVTHNSPFAAALCLFELLGPCRFDGFDRHEPFGVRAKPMSMPLVQIVATSENQTQNTIRMVRAFCQKKGPLARKYDLEVAKTFIETPGGGKLQQMTSSAHSMEGGEVSFVVGDELEHWLPAQGGPAMLQTIQQNAAKMGGRFMGTCNAWVPGEQSSAEAIFEAWCDQEDGLTRGKTKTLYDARIAPPNTVLTDEPEEGQVGLTKALEYVYEDCPWVNLESIKEQIWSPEYPESRSIRFFLNRPNAAEASWITLEEWTQLRKPDRKVEPGERIVMFFDGSKSNDHTALVGCCMEDGHVFKIGHWKPEKPLGVVNVAAVDAGVRKAFDTYNVVAFWADVREWESFTRTAWPEDFGDRLIVPAVRGGMSASPIAWDMRSHAYQFAEAAETAFTEIQQQTFTHDGDSALGEHVSNCRVNEFKGRWSVKKESPKSSKKIDLAVCMIGARMLYRHVKNSKEWADLTAPRGEWKVLM